ncbi:hypothetical protein NDN01_25065 [Sphingomonas sp. QA11]|uniref:hypothetical protein n=1 Tax=Sphingomonas sp. QA11 TaxID=2950605 RepID=UPI00234BFA2B|nr:hypothetical protein [Sphingomonas sp. QA11]WCM27215.1 hypothetical protein NDN01_25065 [Sphingomonas sp. QA11]
MHSAGRTILTATLACGTLDLASAFLFSGLRGTGPVQVLQTVASGPFGDGMLAGGISAALAGLIVHFTIMSAMAGVFVVAAGRLPFIAARPLISGITYGFALYLVMNWIVVPLRWPSTFPPVAPLRMASALFSHIVCVGIPMAYITARSIRRALEESITNT